MNPYSQGAAKLQDVKFGGQQKLIAQSSENIIHWVKLIFFSFSGKQRFAHAAAFFLLSGSLKDALDICIDKLDDLQLAMVIGRLNI